MSRNFEDWIGAYLKYTEHSEAPAEFHLWTAVATIGGALRGKCWFDMGLFKWKPNFFIIFVAPPGIANKSTTSGLGMSLLREVKGIHFGPDSVTWQALTQSFEENVEKFHISGDKKDPKTAKFMEMSCLTLAVSELGTFLDMKNREMIDVLVDLWDGRDVPWVRKTRGGGESIIPSPWVNMLAATTPSWISENMPEYAIGGGFMSRSLFVYGDKKTKLVPYPTENMPEDWGIQRKKLIEDLRKIAELRGGYKLTRKAYEVGTEWYKQHWSAMPEHLKDPRLQGYAARKQTHIHKLAMVLSAAEGDNMIITHEHFDKALILLSQVEENMVKVFDSVSDNYGVKNLANLLGTLKAHPDKAYVKTELYREVATRMTFSQFDEALTDLLSAERCTLKQVGNKTFIQYRKDA